MRSDRWNGLRPGDPVVIANPAIPGATWTFLAHVRNGATGEETVEVVGGKRGRHGVRSFHPTRVYAPRDRPSPVAAPSVARAVTDRLSLADQPRLPLG